jgi:hypothetical protein
MTDITEVLRQVRDAFDKCLGCAKAEFQVHASDFAEEEAALASLDALLSRAPQAAQAEADLLALQRFADSVMEDWQQFGALEGDDLQNIAEACGLLKQQTVDVPCCDEGCGCAEAGATFPTECYFEQAVLVRASRAARGLAAMAQGGQPGDDHGSR